MPRSNRPRRSGRAAARSPEPEELDLDRARSGLVHRQNAPDGTWLVRRITAKNAAKEYRCPGCHLVIPPGLAHLVVWQEDSLFGAQAALADRRHWHQHCWSIRSHRYR
jgi:hypothetical protein